MQVVGGTAIVWEPLIDLVHPAALRAAVKFIQIIDALNIVGGIKRCVAEFKLNVVVPAKRVKRIKDGIIGRSFLGRLRKDGSVFGNIVLDCRIFEPVHIP